MIETTNLFFVSNTKFRMTTKSCPRKATLFHLTIDCWYLDHGREFASSIEDQRGILFLYKNKFKTTNKSSPRRSIPFHLTLVSWSWLGVYHFGRWQIITFYDFYNKFSTTTTSSPRKASVPHLTINRWYLDHGWGFASSLWWDHYNQYSPLAADTGPCLDYFTISLHSACKGLPVAFGKSL